MESRISKFDDISMGLYEKGISDRELEETIGVDVGMENEFVQDEKVGDPEIGMVFDTAEGLFEYYTKYGSENGFPVKKRKRFKNIPEKYILRRWRKDVKRCHTKVKISYFDWMENPENEPFDRMCNAFYETADLATDNEDKTNIVMKWIKCLNNELNNGEVACASSQPTTGGSGQLTACETSRYVHTTTKENGLIRSPQLVRGAVHLSSGRQARNHNLAHGRSPQTDFFSPSLRESLAFEPHASHLCYLEFNVQSVFSSRVL
ncbi:hypothetical protein IFM89_033109 [Coptis chinensis]|uniref:Protein FAR1-RELATED SEQUENCE n=1 Tax=Coptis chinensis TaxID=261450 RepID=A0A835IH35_9MAGN|nr:hypothetical protein IFM89_033109 [Coptis chinensis]